MAIVHVLWHFGYGGGFVVMVSLHVGVRILENRSSLHMGVDFRKKTPFHHGGDKCGM